MTPGEPNPFGSVLGESIRPANQNDLPTLTGIAHEAKRYWGYPREWISAWEPLLTITDQDLAAHTFVVAESDGAPIGFCAVSRQGTTWSVEHLWVLPAHMKRNVGRALLQHAVNFIAARGGKRIEIESDPHAEGFYLRVGARRIGKIPAHMGKTERYLPLLELSIP